MSDLSDSGMFSHLNLLSDLALEALRELGPAPSVQLQDVPREDLRSHIGLRKPRVEAADDLDDELASMSHIGLCNSRMTPSNRQHQIPIRPSSVRLQLIKLRNI